MLRTKSAHLLSSQTEAWIEMAKQRLPADKDLVIGRRATDGQLALSIKNGECTKVTALHCSYEEIDTRMPMHAKHASRDAQRVFIKSHDTDVLLLCVTHNDEIECDGLWFGPGVEDRLRYIPAHKIAAGVGQLKCKVLPAFHALTGCDTISALSRVGRKEEGMEDYCQEQSAPEAFSLCGTIP